MRLNHRQWLAMRTNRLVRSAFIVIGESARLLPLLRAVDAWPAARRSATNATYHGTPSKRPADRPSFGSPRSARVAIRQEQGAAESVRQR